MLWAFNLYVPGLKRMLRGPKWEKLAVLRRTEIRKLQTANLDPTPKALENDAFR